MTVTFITPTANTLFGPGHLCTVNSNVLPVGVNGVWRGTLGATLTAGAGATWLIHPQSNSNNQAIGTFGVNELTNTFVLQANPLTLTIVGPESISLQGTAGQLEMTLFNATLTQVDTGVLPIILDWTQGIPQLIAFSSAHAATASGGFTQADRDLLNRILNDVEHRYANQP